MNKKINITFIFILSFIACSCGSFINKFHKEFDHEEDERRSSQPIRKDRFSLFRKSNKTYNPNSSQKAPYRSLSTRSKKSLMPVTKRNYKPEENRRYKADDLYDNEADGSLWAGHGQSGFLFSKNNHKKIGDIVIIQVMEKLKKEITTELARAFPPPPKKAKKTAGDQDTQNSNGQGQDQEKSDNEEDGGQDKVYDRISCVVVEEINKDHILVRGQKEVLFRKRKRLVEIEAMVSRRDISDDDSVTSDRILESSISVLR